jgi:acyl carrier protein
MTVRLRPGPGRDALARPTAHGAKAILRVHWRDYGVDDKRILDIVHQTAAEMMTAEGGEAAGHGSAVSTEGTDSLIDGYGFSSIDALKYLLILEEKFGITLADQDLNDEVLYSATALAKRIAALLDTQGQAQASG